MNIDNRNLTMLMDLYELTMANGIMDSEYNDTVTYFDMFFRRIPDEGGYAIMAGIKQLIEYLDNLHFDDSDIEYLKSLNLFSEQFIDYLRTFRFTC
ncbi:MAG: nicotinate phosphoribosyltransferase, partial [Clostridia bacterium]|nr:nicotinate phosphoribosyltransferase [Clostridia bacterium]